MKNSDLGRVQQAEPGSTSLRSPEPEVSAHSGDDPSRDGSALIWFPERRGWLLLRENGEGRFIDLNWLAGAKIAFVGAHIKGLIAYLIVNWFGTGDPGGWRWRLLPSYGDWAYRNDHGRLSSLARFIDVDLTLWPRARDSDGSPKGGDACGSVHDSAGPKDIAPDL